MTGRSPLNNLAAYCQLAVLQEFESSPNETLGHMWNPLVMELAVTADFCAGFRRSAVVVCGYDGGDDTSACP